MSYPLKAHTLPILAQVIAQPDLDALVRDFIQSFHILRQTPLDPQTDPQIIALVTSLRNPIDDLHTYLALINGQDPLFDRIYFLLGNSPSSAYAAGPLIDPSAYVAACTAAGHWSRVEFQDSPGYLICYNDTVAYDERLILNFCTQADAFAFVDALRLVADRTLAFKVLLATAAGPLNDTEKNDKVVLYYTRARRAERLAQVDTLLAGITLEPSLSGFYLALRPGVGMAAETDSTWSFTMYNTEYCIEYLLRHSAGGPEAGIPPTADGMYDYVVRRLVADGRLSADQIDPADRPAGL